MSEGPAVAAAKVSLDGRMMALQRSAGHLQFMDLSSTKTFVQVCCSAAAAPTCHHCNPALHNHVTAHSACTLSRRLN